MSSDLAMNVNTNDIVFVNNDVMMIDDAAKIAQQILITLRFWYGEWFLNTTEGTPYLEYILVKQPNMAHIRQILTEQIQSVEGVKAVTDMELTFDQRERSLLVEYTADTDYGLVTDKAILGYNKEV
jgi:hypothetical protein